MTATDPKTEAVTGVPFTLNGQDLVAEEGELLIEACDRNGVHIPRFCYHKRMEPVGMCRMCLVEVDTGRGSALQPSCMLPVTPEMKVETESEATKQAQDGVLELLLTNHPLDCPVCDKGGECPLQDNAFAFGPGESRFVEEKRHFEKPIPISDLVNLDRERCILCDRCTRFSSDVAGDALIHFIDRGSHTQVNTFPDHPFASYFSGNTVQICPVGALTAEPYRFKARPWDLEATSSTAAVDSTGSRVLIQSSQDKVVRILGVDSDAVNWGWLSDKERFIYEANQSDSRVSAPMVNTSGQLSPVRWNDALEKATQLLSGAKTVAAIGGARLTLESQFAWAKLLKSELGVKDIDASLGDELSASVSCGVSKSTYDDAFAKGSSVITIGEDLKEIMPTLFLRLRDAVTKGHVDLVEVSYSASALASLAAARIELAPGDLVAAVTSALAVLDADKPLTVLFSRPNAAESEEFLSQAISSLTASRPEVKFIPLMRRGNLTGSYLAGLSSAVDTGCAPAEEVGKNTAEILQACVAGEVDTLVLLGADPIADFPDVELAKSALAAVSGVVAVDCFLNSSTIGADVVLPVAMHGETDGTFVNAEGRLSPLVARVSTVGQTRPDWAIAAGLSKTLPATLSELTALMVSDLNVAGLELDWDKVGSNPDGVVVSPAPLQSLDSGKVAETINPDRLKLVVGHKLWDKGTMLANSVSLDALSEEAQLGMNPQDVADLGLTNGEQIKVSNAHGAGTLRVSADAAITKGCVWAPLNVTGFDPRTLISSSDPVCYVDVSSAGEVLDG